MPKNKVPRRTRTSVQENADGCCEYCRSQEKYSPDAFVVEHIVPEDKGGASDIGNLAFSCQGCNNHKFTATNAIDPVTGNDTPLFHPRLQKWDEHFVWSNDFEQCLGVTPTGRATVERLHLNRSGVTNLRRVLRTQQLHPPVDAADKQPTE